MLSSLLFSDMSGNMQAVGAQKAPNDLCCIPPKSKGLQNRSLFTCWKIFRDTVLRLGRETD